MSIQAGFLIVKTYPRLYRDYVTRYSLKKPLYALPRLDQDCSQMLIQYRGLDRDALKPYRDSDNLAEVRMAELQNEERCNEDGFLPSLEIAMEVMQYVSNADDYEVIWTRIARSGMRPLLKFYSAGYDPTYFTGDHFSASCDCMMIPRWHGTDKEGTLFQEHFLQLNQYGLFSSPDHASTFLNYYLSFDWTETGDYEIAEIFLQQEVSKLRT